MFKRNTKEPARPPVPPVNPCENGHDMKTDWVENNAKEGTTTIHRVCRRPACGHTDMKGPFRA